MPLDNRTCFRVNLRDGLACRLCDKKPTAADDYHHGFEYHHVQPKSLGGTDTVDNIILLCHYCHQRAHQNKAVSAVLVELPRTAPEEFDCAGCGKPLSAVNVPCNCGWYCCTHCGEQIHLFEHHKHGHVKLF